MFTAYKKLKWCEIDLIKKTNILRRGIKRVKIRCSITSLIIKLNFTRDVAEFSLVAVGVNVSVFSSYNTICASGLLLEASICCLVAESEGSVIVQLVVISDRLHRRSSWLGF